MKKKRLTSAIQNSMRLIAAVSLMPVAAMAQEESSEQLEEVYVTGSRIPILVSDSARPITTLDTEQLKLQGINDITSSLRNNAFNGLGSFRDQSGSSFGQVSLVDLKGLGADRTLVLINGRRVPGNPLTGDASVDLNTIPFAAVERIDVLTDSASAVYGADAIGGVVNIIMKEDFQGFEMSLGHDSPSRDDATTDRFDLTYGHKSDKGSMIFSLDYYKRLPVFDEDRDYSRVRVTQPSSGLPVHTVDTVGVSAGGNTGFDTDFTEAFQIGGSCNEDFFIPISSPFGLDGDGCGFGYADISMQTGGIERTSMLANGDYEINDDHTLFFENRVTRSSTIGRFAPAVGFVRVAADAPLNDRGEEFDLFHRFVGHGNRDDSIEITEMDNLIGVEGKLFSTDINYDVFARRYVYNANSEGDTYIITSIIQDLIADGSYNFINPTEPDNADAIARSSATLTRDLSTEMTHVGFGFNGSFASLAGGAIGWYSGFEWAEEEYQDQYDNLREAGNVTGSSGNSSSGDRERWAVSGEMLFPITDTFNLTAAARYDDYSDFGGEFSPSVSAKFDPIDMVGFRASWSQGFKAPNLGDLYSELSQSFEGVTDILRCESQGIAEEDCANVQVEEYTGGNPELLAETSESINLGIIVKPIDGLDISLDFWNVEMEDRVSTLDLEDVLVLERTGELPPGVIVNRAPTQGGVVGSITPCVGNVTAPDCGIINVFGNLSTFDVSGLDLKVSHSFDTSFGSFTETLAVAHYLKYDEQPIPGGEVFDRPGTSDYPDTRATGTIGWNLDEFNIVYTLGWIAGHEGGSAAQEYDAWSKHDINFTWSTDYNVDLSFGILNFTDEDPSVSKVSGWTASTSETSTDLYDVAGRTYSLTATLRLD